MYRNDILFSFFNRRLICLNLFLHAEGRMRLLGEKETIPSSVFCNICIERVIGCQTIFCMLRVLSLFRKLETNINYILRRKLNLAFWNHHNAAASIRLIFFSKTAARIGVFKPQVGLGLTLRFVTRVQNIFYTDVFLLLAFRTFPPAPLPYGILHRSTTETKPVFNVYPTVESICKLRMHSCQAR